ncbi:MAG: DUF362 domain-containing protein [Acidobacteria bacterium]|nr:DUF362 domain-containing protein [Acidobacteriota bacterium]
MCGSRYSRRELLNVLGRAAPGLLVAPDALLARAAAPPGADLSIVDGRDVRAATRQAIAALGGMRRFVSRNDVVLVKPNIGWARGPAQGANTHPDVVAAVIEMCHEAGASVVKVADYSIDVPERAYLRSGVRTAVERAHGRFLAVDPARFKRMRTRGEFVKEWDVCPEAVECDKRINVPVAKHHSLCRVTIAMKNWFGMLGGERARLHDRIHVAIADVAQFFDPHLTVMDATRVLVRNGPQGGSLADVERRDIVAASANQVAIDAFGATLLGIRPHDVGFLKIAEQRGMGAIDLARLRVVRRPA